MTSGISNANSVNNTFDVLKKSKVVSEKNKPTRDEGNVEVTKIPTEKVLLGNAAGIGLGLATPAYQLFETFEKITKDKAQAEAMDMRWYFPDYEPLETTKKSAQQIYEESGLKGKGVELLFVEDSPKGEEELHTFLDKVVPKKSKINKRLNENYFHTFNEGSNAVYIDGGKKGKAVIVSEKQLHNNVFHELGHAMNANGNVITKSLFKSKILSPYGVPLIMPILLANALWHKDSDKNKNDEKIMDKTRNFLAKHAVGLTALSLAPMVAEEGLASIRGLRAASKYLPKESVRKLGWNYSKAFMTYVLLSGGITLGVDLGIKLANKIKTDAHNKKIMQNT